MTVLPTDKQRTSLPLVLSTAIIMFAVALAWRFLTFSGFSNDHYAHFALAQQMLLGERPIRDFSDPGWPLTYILSAGAWWFAGSTMWVEWTIVAVAFALGAAFTVAAASRLSGSLWIAVVVTLVELAVYPRTYSYPKVLVYAVGAWLLAWMADRPSPNRLVVMSLAIATAFLLRHDHGLYLGVAAAACVALSSRHEGWATALGRTAGLTTATALWLVPWILFLMANGGLANYFDRALEYARTEADATRLKAWPRFTLEPDEPLFGLERPDRPFAQVRWSANVSAEERSDLERHYHLDYVRDSDDARWYYVTDPSEANLRALADDPRAAATSGLGRVSRPLWREFLAYVSPFRVAPALHSAANADAWLYWLYWSLPVLCILLAATRWLKGIETWPGEFPVVVSLSIMTLLVNSGFLRDILRDRLADAVVPPVLLAAWALGLCWGRRWRGRRAQLVCQVTALVALTATVGSAMRIGDWQERFDGTGVSDGFTAARDRARKVSALLALPHRQDVAPPSRVAAALMPFFEYVDRCSLPADQLVVTSDYPEIPVLAGRAFGGDGVVMGSWYSSARHQDRTVDQLRSRPPLFVIYIDGTSFKARYPLIEAFVASEYMPMADIPVENAGSVVVMTHKARHPASVDRDTGWPCFRS